LLAGVTLKKGGCGQRGGNRERPMVFHDEVTSYRSRSCLLEAKLIPEWWPSAVATESSEQTSDDTVAFNYCR
jgi:hypothetical protein